MKNKSQLSIFFIVAIFLILILIIFFSVISINKSNYSIQSSTELLPVQSYLDSCLDSTVESSILHLGRNGMHYNTLQTSQEIISAEYRVYGDNTSEVFYTINIIPYYIKNNTSFLPTLSEIESEISAKVSNSFLDCSEIALEGYTIIIPNNSITAELSSSKVITRLTKEIKVLKAEEEFIIDEMYNELDFPLIPKYTLVKSFIDEQMKDTTYFNTGYLLDLAYRNQFKYETNYVEEGIIKYNFIFNDFPENIFIYSFLIDFGW